MTIAQQFIAGFVRGVESASPGCLRHISTASGSERVIAKARDLEADPLATARGTDYEFLGYFRASLRDAHLL